MEHKIESIRDVLQAVFMNYEGTTEIEEVSANIISDVADTLSLTSDAVQSDVPDKEAIWKTLRRCEDRLRLALRMDEFIDNDADDEPEKTETGLEIAEGGAS